MNLSVLEEWIGEMQLPRGIGSHFAPVKDLLTWLQVADAAVFMCDVLLIYLQSLSSITEFPNLIATIQTLRNLNPLQVWQSLCSPSRILNLTLDAPCCSRLPLRG